MNRQYRIYQRGLFFLGSTLVARCCTLFYSSIDHDESTYLLIAQEWLHGHLPWADYMDIKPIGIYVLFAGAIKLFGSSFLAARILAVIFISATALIVDLILRACNLSSLQALVGGFLFIISISLHQWSWSSNTEIFFVFFTAAGILVFLRDSRPRNMFCMGLLFGLGFCIKYHIAFDLLAVMLTFWMVDRKTPWQKLMHSVWAAVGFLIPILFWLGSYLALGQQALLQEVLIDIPSRYSTSSTLGQAMSFLGEFYLVFLPISLLFFYSSRTHWRKAFQQRFRNLTKATCLAILWPPLVWVAILLTGKGFFHYYIQQILPLVVVGSLSLPWATSKIPRRLRTGVIVCLSLLLLAAPLHQAFILFQKQDVALAATEIIKKDLSPGDVIFANTDHIVYLLCDRPPPTRYVHSSIFHKPDLQEAFGMDLEKELGHIFAQQPRYCLVKGTKDASLLKYLENYSLVQTFRGNVELWRI